MNLPRAPKRGDLSDLDAVFDRLLSPRKKPMADPYRTAPLNEAKRYVLEAIEQARSMQRRIMIAVNERNNHGMLDRDDVAMVDKLNETYRAACEHERELLKQLEGLER